jgi:hypothetical protein
MCSSMYWRGLALAVVLGLLGLGFADLSVAASKPYVLEPELSLTGACGNKDVIDPIEDPGCPGGTHPPEGRFNEPRSVAVDSYGNEYVASYATDGSKGRIDVFDDEGKFITELLDPKGPKSIAVDGQGNLYAFDRLPGPGPTEIARYAPSVYKPKSGEIEYKNPRVVIATAEAPNGGVASDLSNDRLFVDLGGSIREYDSAVKGNGLLSTITHEKLKGSNWVAVDSQRRRLYASYCKEGIFKCGILVFEADAPYELLKEIDGSTVPAGKFVSGKGWLSTAVDEQNGHFFVDDLEASNKVYEFDEDFEYFATVESTGFAGGNALQIAVANNPLNKENRNFEYLFVPVLFGATRVLAFEPPEERPPKILSLEATNIGETEAELRAKIDPEGGDTDYVLEIEGPGLEGPQIVAQGTIPGTSLPQEVGGLVGGLEPGAEYSLHAFAENEAGDDDEAGVFATFSDAQPTIGPCPNDALRAGSSAALPDCRAYELVSPADTNGRSIKGAGGGGDRFAMVQAAPSGNALSFEMRGGVLPGTEGSGGFYGDPYRATRSASGWSTVLTGPTGSEADQPQAGSVSPDQRHLFSMASGEGTAVVGEQETHYIRYPDGHAELVGRGSLGTEPEAIGKLITENGTHIVFQTRNIFGTPSLQLEPNAPPTGTTAVYDRTPDEVTHVVSLLPGNVTPTKDSAYLGASADGVGIAFEIDGNLYLRLGNATTFQIGTKGAKFAGVSEEGGRVFYLEGGDLLAFDTGTEEVIEFTETGDAVPVNVAPEGSRAYFVSEEEIAGSGSNPNGDEPQAGEQNLYRSDEGAISFVGTVTERDVEGINTAGGKIDGLGLWMQAAQGHPETDPSRLTPDGGVFLFQSRENLDGYEPGEFPQVYRYDSGASLLECLSCPPTKTSPIEGASLQSFAFTDLASPFQNGFVPNLRADGARAFFESTEALVSSDTDGVRDVYEWEEAGVGSCTRAGGCIYLISTGHSARGNYLFGHSASGDDVFFTTGDVLVGGDEDTVSVYDARVNGGFAEPEPVICLEEVCKPGITPPPSLPASESGARHQSGNSTPTKTCPKGKRKVIRHGKEVCIKKKKHRKANNNRRAGK